LPGDDLPLLIGAAQAAGQIAMAHWKGSVRSWSKDDHSPVSDADMAVNEMLARTLRAARPAYGWLSEETPDDPARLAARRVFIVDPIDGTRAFLDGSRHFAHSLAVAEDGRVVAGVVYLPAEDLLYAATAEGPAIVNGRPIHAATTVQVERARVLTSGATMAAENWAGGAPPPFRREFRASLAWRLCLVAEGSFDAMITLRPAWEWDIAAGTLIAERAGAQVSDRYGERPVFNSSGGRADGLIAAAPLLRDALAARLAAATGR
jgi:myo-inositol-1(or 4)-monophosphatase